MDDLSCIDLTDTKEAPPSNIQFEGSPKKPSESRRRRSTGDPPAKKAHLATGDQNALQIVFQTLTNFEQLFKNIKKFMEDINDFVNIVVISSNEGLIPKNIVDLLGSKNLSTLIAINLLASMKSSNYNLELRIIDRTLFLIDFKSNYINNIYKSSCIHIKIQCKNWGAGVPKKFSVSFVPQKYVERECRNYNILKYVQTVLSKNYIDISTDRRYFLLMLTINGNRTIWKMHTVQTKTRLIKMFDNTVLNMLNKREMTLFPELNPNDIISTN